MAGFGAAALVTLNAAYAAALPILAAAGINTAALTAAMGTATAAASALGPAAPFALAAVYLTRTALVIRKSHEKAGVCKNRAGVWAIEQPSDIIVVASIPTTDWEECWHRGIKKTKDKYDGRYSERIPGTVIRRDVLPISPGYGADLARAATGSPLAKGEVFAADWLGPWGLSRGGTRPNDLVGWSPSATVATTGAMRSMLTQGTTPSVRAKLAEVALWAAKAANGEPTYMVGGKTKVVLPEAVRAECKAIAIACMEVVTA